jgi:hypothetical protein
VIVYSFIQRYEAHGPYRLSPVVVLVYYWVPEDKRQEQVSRFSEALSTMDLSDFTPLGSAQASQKDVETAEDPAISRLRPIQDGLDFWGMHGGAVTGSGAPRPT